MPVRVFISSIMSGYAEYRDAAREGIEAAGAKPVLIEDHPSQPTSPRTACLDLVASAEITVVVIAHRGGSTAPSGKLVVEEEFEEARRLGRSILVFLESGERDAEAARLADRLSDYREGRYRREFRTPEELRGQVTAALEPLMSHFDRKPTQPDEIQDALDTLLGGDGAPRAAIAIAPSTEDEIVDPVDLDDRSLTQDLLEAAHRSEFFSHAYGGKRPQVDARSLSIKEIDESRYSAAFRARFTLTTHGWLILDKTLAGSDERHHDHSMSYMFELPVDELAVTLGEMLSFAASAIQRIDPHERHPTWLYNVGLGSLGHRRIVDQRTHSQRYSMSLDESGPLVAFDAPRPISRAALRGDRDREIERVVTLLRRHRAHNP